MAPPAPPPSISSDTAATSPSRRADTALAPAVAPPPVSAPTAQAIPGGAQAVTLVTVAPSTPDPRAGSGSAQTQPLGGTVYFDFDSSEVRGEGQSLLQSHARALQADRSRRVVVEGHTDERGGREYNLALGQRRADNVRQALITLGASDQQLEAVSFGKEKPAVQGSDEAALARNRRAELKERR